MEISGEQVNAILLDFSKAFDKVPHQRLPHKLEFYGVRGTTLNWIQSFLTDRTQPVALEGTLPATVPVTSGVPQGTVLGHLLFLLYINDLPDVVKQSKVSLFADDSLLYRNVKNEQDQALLQEDLDALATWETTWQMSFNPSTSPTSCTERVKLHVRLSITCMDRNWSQSPTASILGLPSLTT